ncbi:hypothetical protein ElyMa_006082400 [Elysia marginata]|uniref:Uncharacterized protein n=1 Tax=Elysia marginata TaxID=1093978 RepID=A0AAV4GQ39_9GAST|nr:hypothetical protein ElyMa_006082400 [Elysia marginata]
MAEENLTFKSFFKYLEKEKSSANGIGNTRQMRRKTSEMHPESPRNFTENETDDESVTNPFADSTFSNDSKDSDWNPDSDSEGSSDSNR